MEAKTQKKLIQYLKRKGCYVIKTKPGPGTPVGCPDVIALYEGWWGAFEIKADAKSRFTPLQKDTIKKFNDWSMAWIVHSENIDDVISELNVVL